MQFNLASVLALAGFLTETCAAPALGNTIPKVVATTREGNQTIDWIVRDSQGIIASPPPLPPSSAKRGDSALNFASVFGQREAGPPGTVPILRTPVTFPPKQPPPSTSYSQPQTLSAAQSYANSHWYASSNENALNHGAGGKFSLFDAYTENDHDFTLIQMAVARDNTPQPDSSQRKQTVEAGWMKWPSVIGGGPFLFTYYTTNGYTSMGDNVGGYNQQYQGWVQYDNQIYPGIHLAPLSVRGGAQNDVQLSYMLYGGNWWLLVGNRYVGYYPASLFSSGGRDPAQTLESQAGVALFYGEVLNSQDSLTKTDMGSGEFPEAGKGRAAYIRNIFYYDEGLSMVNYDSHGQFIVSDRSRYRLQDNWNSGSDWGSYMFVGGPGAGGVVGG